MGADTNSCGCRETVVAKVTVRIEAESEIGTARKIAEFPTSFLQRKPYSYLQRQHLQAHKIDPFFLRKIWRILGNNRSFQGMIRTGLFPGAAVSIRCAEAPTVSPDAYDVCQESE